MAACHALDHYRLGAGAVALVKGYRQTKDGIELGKEAPVTFQNGALVFPNTADSTILNVIMEPDFNPSNPDRKMTLLRMGLLEIDEDGRLPLYCYCRTLEGGKIAADD